MRSSYRHSLHMVTKKNPDNTMSVRYQDKQWNDDSTIIITTSFRCQCKKRIAYEFQCGHEYVLDGVFNLDKYHPRWYNDKTFANSIGDIGSHNSSSQQTKTSSSQEFMQDKQDDGHMFHINDKIGNTSSSNYDDLEECSWNAAEQSLDLYEVGYHDVKSRALEVVESVSNDKNLRRVAHHFLTEFLHAIRCSGEGTGVIHLMNSSLLPDIATTFNSEITTSSTIVNETLLQMKQIPARPPKGSKPQNRIKSSLEKSQSVVVL